MPDCVIPYTAREAFVPFHQRTERDAVLVCHRRAGKTVALVIELILRALANTRTQPPPQYAFFYPTWKRAKDIAWPYLKYYTKPIPGRIVREGDLSIELWDGGPKITLYGAANSRGVGLYLDGVIYDECDEIPNTVIAEVAPALMDRKGWSVYAGMLKGRYNLWKRYSDLNGKPGAFTLCLRASESKIYSDAELVRLRATMGESAYEMQLECNPNAAIANAIYGKQMDDMRKENRIRRLAVVADVPLYVFFDIGHSLQGDDWTMWVMQFDGRDVLVHRYHARTGELPAYYANVIFGFESELRARVHTVYLPHDGTRQDRHGASAKDDLEAAGLRGRVRTVVRTPKLWDSINDVRAMLARVHIDQEGCGQGWTLGENEMPSGIDCLDFYTKKVEAQTGMITEIPVHNQYSHGADAFRTFVEAQKNGLIDGGMSSYERGGPVHSIKVSREANPYQQAARRRPISVR
jgi:hypothetical protein